MFITNRIKQLFYDIFKEYPTDIYSAAGRVNLMGDYEVTGKELDAFGILWRRYEFDT